MILSRCHYYHLGIEDAVSNSRGRSRVPELVREIDVNRYPERSQDVEVSVG